jgi:hypothetical protein
MLKLLFVDNFFVKVTFFSQILRSGFYRFFCFEANNVPPFCECLHIMSEVYFTLIRLLLLGTVRLSDKFFFFPLTYFLFES